MLERAVTPRTYPTPPTARPYNPPLMESPEVRNAVERGYIRANEVAHYLGITQQRVSQLAAGDGFPTPRIVAGRQMWKRSGVERWAERHWWGTRAWRVKSPP